MRVYSVVWSTATAACVLIGIAIALATEPAYAVLILFATVAICAGVIAANLRALEAASRLSTATGRRVVADSVVTGSIGVACFGMAVAVGVWLVPVVTGLTITSPSGCSLMARWLTDFRSTRTSGTSAGPASIAEVTDESLAAWTDSALYAVWLATKAEITKATDAPHAATAARARQLLLAEIERRYPVQTEAWLSSEGAITGEPPEFLRTIQDT